MNGQGSCEVASAKNTVTRSCGHEVMTNRTSPRRLESLAATPCGPCLRGEAPAPPRDIQPPRPRKAGRHVHQLTGKLRWRMFVDSSLHLMQVCETCGAFSKAAPQTRENVVEARLQGVEPFGCTWEQIEAFGPWVEPVEEIEF